MSDLAHEGNSLPVGAIGSRASGWWGAWFLVLSEASIFAYLFFVYFYYAIQPQAQWVPQPPSFLYSGPQTAIMAIGCVSAWWAERSAQRAARGALLAALLLTLLLASVFIALQVLDWMSEPFPFAASAYSSIYFTIGGFHLAHVLVGWIIFALLPVWTALGYFDAVRHLPITVGAFYWYFLAAVWLAVFFVLYLTPYLG